MPIVIGIAGASGAGKTTFAKKIEAALVARGKTVEHMCYADPFYKILNGLGYSCPQDSHSNPELGRWFKEAISFRRSGRDLLAAVGEAVLAYDPEVWTNVLEARVAVSKADVVIVSDVRYPERGEWACIPHENRFCVCRDGDRKVPGAAHYLSRAGTDGAVAALTERFAPAVAAPTRTCTTCASWHLGMGLDFAPPRCWDCSSSEYYGGTRLPFWQPKEQA